MDRFSVAENIPAAIWIKSSSKQTSNHHSQINMNSNDFMKIMAPQMQNITTFIVIAEPYMNENDLFAADTVFKNIKKIMYPMYNLSIRDNITSYLSSLTSVRWRYLTLTPGAQKFKLPTLDNASLFLTLDSDLARNRSALFLRHDKIIVELFNLVNELLETFVFMFTSFSSEWNTNYIENRHLVGPQIFSKPILLKNKAILMFSKTSPMITIRRPSYMETLWLTNMTSLAAEENELIVQAPENCINIGTIKFKYSDFEGYMWSMDNIIISPKSKNKQMNGSLKLQKKVTLKILDGMPRVRSFSDMSYHCHRSIVFSDQEGKIELIFNNVQTQPALMKMTFGDSRNCEDFFSPMYIVYVYIFFMYLFVFLMMLKLLNNIQVHKDFEDPNKPYLTVNTAPI